MEQLLAKLLEELAVIKQAPLSFFIVWLFGATVTYILIRRGLRGQLDDFRQWLVDRDNVIEFLQKKLDIEQKFLEPTAATPPALTATKASALDAPKKEQLLPPVIELIRFDFDDVAKDASGFYYRSSSNLLFKVAVLDFSLKPISGAVPWTEVQPQIRFKDSHGRITLVSDAIWFGHDKPKVPFRYGVTNSLVLASRAPKRDFRTYERSSHESQPLERQLNGTRVLAEVRLVGEYMDDPKAEVFCYLELTKGDSTVSITKSTRAIFES